MESCVHCDESVYIPYFVENEEEKSGPFCCQGCLTVYQTLHQKGLGEYYQVKHDVAYLKRRSPVEIKSDSFIYLDSADFLEEFTYSLAANQRTMEFYLEGIHCLACLWLIEKLPDFVEGVISSKLNLEKSVAVITIDQSGSFARAAYELNRLGYRPHALKKNTEAEIFQQSETRKNLIRIGVSGAAAGNIMIYAVSLYGGASAQLGEVFNFLTVILSFPVLTYCAWPFYTSAWNSIKNKSLSIDVPISMALIMGAIMGVVNVFLGVPENYLDSLTTLVFLLLLSRYFLKAIQDRGLSATDLNFFYQSDAVLRQDPMDKSKFSEIHSRYVKKNDVLKIKTDDFFAADGILLSDETRVNNSLLTGESHPVKVFKGEKIFSGTQNLGPEVIVSVDSIHTESRLGKILRHVENGWSNVSNTVDITSKVSKYFTAAVFILSFILFFIVFANHNFETALVQAVTLLIVTCPCALALAVPLTFNRSLSLAAKNGLIIKSDQVIETLSQIENIFLDKTGTITEGKPSVSDFSALKITQTRVEDVIFTLEESSRHPVGRALMNYIIPLRAKRLDVKDKIEIPGKGVRGVINNSVYEINRDGIFENGILVACFKVKDLIRKDSKIILERLKKLGPKTFMLSGDKAEIAQTLGIESGIETSHIFAEMSPESKLQKIKEFPHTIMVGDGANDAMALQAADVGVAVAGAMDISLRASDVFLTAPGLEGVEKAIILSKETMKIVYRNLVFSILYNIVSVYFVFNNMISPLTAAIIMPLSSLTVLISSIIGTKKMRSLWKS